jgi:hypothetical protein
VTTFHFFERFEVDRERGGIEKLREWDRERERKKERGKEKEREDEWKEGEQDEGKDNLDG